MFLGRPAVAEQSFQSALRLDDQHPESHGGLAVSLLIQRREPEARGSLLSCRNLNAESPSGVYAERLLEEGSGATLNLSEILVRVN
ncbi:hypothetical protein ACSFBF_19290 [Variovorax sp. ZT5P49]|uniref:hypothetical protein n=1 Tax=Variovorax sp. ZT5P49 TaxID=3443733 RepID=UPI003F4836C0